MLDLQETGAALLPTSTAVLRQKRTLTLLKQVIPNS